MSDLVIHITNEQRQRIEEWTRQHGYESVTDYLLSFVEDTEPTKEDIVEGFREGWAAAMKGDTIPASKLRDYIKSEEIRRLTEEYTPS